MTIVQNSHLCAGILRLAIPILVIGSLSACGGAPPGSRAALSGVDLAAMEFYNPSLSRTELQKKWNGMNQYRQETTVQRYQQGCPTAYAAGDLADTAGKALVEARQTHGFTSGYPRHPDLVFETLSTWRTDAGSSGGSDGGDGTDKIVKKC